MDLPIPLLPGQEVRLESDAESSPGLVSVKVDIADCEPAEVAGVVRFVVEHPQDYPYAGAQLDAVAQLTIDRSPEWLCALAEEILRGEAWQLGPELIKFLRLALASDDDPRTLEKLIAAELADRRLRDPLTRDSAALRSLVASRRAAHIPDGWVISETIMWAACNHDQRLLDAALPLVLQRDTPWQWQVALRLTHMLTDSAGTQPSPLSGSELNEVAPLELSRILSAQAPLLATRLGPVAETLAHELAYLYNPESQVAAFNIAVSRRARGRRMGRHNPMQSVSRIFGPDTGLLRLPQKESSGSIPFDGVGPSRRSLNAEHNDGPKISVIVPVRNGMPYIHGAITSILAQDYPNVEVIVIDGASTDGTAGFLESMRDNFDYFVSEPDSGQSQAINKGIAVASGDYIGWLNADDELLPGALSEIARVIKRTNADLVAGITVVERDGVVVMVTRTQMEPGTLAKDGLLDLFGKWFKGYYFYQPEVFIKRSTLERAGAYVEEDLYFTMDYDLWLRLADSGARVASCDWPVALFRQHPDQKTADLTATIGEQLMVWEKHRPDTRPLMRLCDLSEHIEVPYEVRKLRVLFHSTRFAKVFSPRIRRDLPEFMDRHGIDLIIPSMDGSVDDLEGIDVVVMPIHVRNEHLLISKWRRLGLEAPVVGWLWDNHHSHIAHSELLPHLDVVVPGHSMPQGPLQDLGGIWTEALPLCVSQWTMNEVDSFTDGWNPSETRSTTMMGGFVDYPSLGRRTKELVEVMKIPGFEDVVLIDEDHLLDSYFALPGQSRFDQWSAHQTSLVWPLHGDLSQRFFDALLAGQVPVVVDAPRDLQTLLEQDPELADHVVISESTTTESLSEARQQALETFTRYGSEGVRYRHVTGRAHTLEARLLSISAAVFGQERVSP